MRRREKINICFTKEYNSISAGITASGADQRCFGREWKNSFA